MRTELNEITHMLSITANIYVLIRSDFDPEGEREGWGQCKQMHPCGSDTEHVNQCDVSVMRE